MNKYLIYVILLLLLGSFLFILNIFSFLSVNKPVNSKTLVIEGWISPLVLEGIADTLDSNDYDHIIISGVKKRPYNRAFSYEHKSQLNNKKPILLNKKSIVIVPNLFSEEKITSISVFISNPGSKNNKPHCSILLDTVLIGGCFAKDSVAHEFSFQVDSGKFNNIILFYDNDVFISGNDRNLLIHGITINKKYMPMYSGGLVKITGPSIEKNQILQSSAYCSLNYLRDLGLYSNKIVAIVSSERKRNKTLSSVKEFKEWSDHYIKDKSFNVVSLGIHARRSIVTYKKVFGKHYNIGIISYEHPNYNKSNWWKRRNAIIEVIKEFLAYSYVKFIL